MQALAGIVFGASSLSVAYSVFTLQQNAVADAALDRAATLIERVHESSLQRQRFIDADDATAGNRAYDCVIYLKYRVAYTQHWTATKLSDAPYLISPGEIGKQPEPDDLPENQRTQWDEITGQFNKCIGRYDAGQGGGDPQPTPAQIRKRGETIRRRSSRTAVTGTIQLVNRQAG